MIIPSLFLYEDLVMFFLKKRGSVQSSFSRLSDQRIFWLDHSLSCCKVDLDPLSQSRQTNQCNARPFRRQIAGLFYGRMEKVESGMRNPEPEPELKLRPG